MTVQYEDISRKHTNLDSEATRASERADMEEKKIMELEEELKVGGGEGRDVREDWKMGERGEGVHERSEGEGSVAEGVKKERGYVIGLVERKEGTGEGRGIEGRNEGILIIEEKRI